jgi:hypothetical protein
MNIDSTWFDDIYEAWEPVWYQNPWILLSIFCAIVTLVFIALLLYRFFMRKQPINPLVTYQKSLTRLGDRDDGLHDYEQQYAFYLLATECIKWTADTYYQASISHKTDAEVLKRAQHDDFSNELTSLITDVFPAAQRVKFSCEAVSSEAAMRHYRHIANFLKKTAHRPHVNQ